MGRWGGYEWRPGEGASCPLELLSTCSSKAGYLSEPGAQVSARSWQTPEISLQSRGYKQAFAGNLWLVWQVLRSKLWSSWFRERNCGVYSSVNAASFPSSFPAGPLFTPFIPFAKLLIINQYFSEHCVANIFTNIIFIDSIFSNVTVFYQIFSC